VTPARTPAPSASLTPAEQYVTKIEQAQQATGHRYELRFTAPDRFTVRDLTTGAPVGEGTHDGETAVTQVPGFPFTLKGEARAGDAFVIETMAPKPLDYAVHVGMVLTPIAHFIAEVRRSPELETTYGAAARRYLETIEALVARWDPLWRDFGPGRGAYIGQFDESHRMPGGTLPHNQYLALGRTVLALSRITGKPLYKERAEKMARFFKAHLRLVEGHYEWNYWDPAGPHDDPWRHTVHLEDASHGTIDIDFAVEAHESGLVFDRRDMEHFAATVRDVMWNGSLEAPALGANVATNKGDYRSPRAWVRLGAYDPRVREIFRRMFETAFAPNNAMIADWLLYYG
jgi:hypothetical protein